MHSFLAKTITSKIGTTSATFLLPMFVMTIYESLKHTVFGNNISLWESHAITIVFTSIIGASLAWFFSDRLHSHFLQKSEIELREERSRTHHATMFAAYHYLNNAVNMLQLIKLEINDVGKIDPRTLAMLDGEIFKTQTELGELGKMQEPTQANIKKFISDRLQ